MLKVDRVAKVFGGIEALRDVSLRLDAGPIYGLIGPNGAGKTTLFNVVTGLSRATSGTIRFDGRPITDLPAHRIARLGIARTYQLVRPFLELTAFENVEVGIAYGRPAAAPTPRDMRAEALHYLEMVGLAARRHHTAEQLNLGERKRLEVAKALAAKPELLLLDEVLAGLNPTEVASALELLRQVHRMGITVLMIEHNMQAIMAACSHIFVLHHGLLIGQGSPAEVSRDSAVVEAYLGGRDQRFARPRRSGAGA